MGRNSCKSEFGRGEGGITFFGNILLFLCYLPPKVFEWHLEEESMRVRSGEWLRFKALSRTWHLILCEFSTAKGNKYHKLEPKPTTCIASRL